MAIPEEWHKTLCLYCSKFDPWKIGEEWECLCDAGNEELVYLGNDGKPAMLSISLCDDFNPLYEIGG